MLKTHPIIKHIATKYDIYVFIISSTVFLGISNTGKADNLTCEIICDNFASSLTSRCVC